MFSTRACSVSAAMLSALYTSYPLGHSPLFNPHNKPMYLFTIIPTYGWENEADRGLVLPEDTQPLLSRVAMTKPAQSDSKT